MKKKGSSTLQLSNNSYSEYYCDFRFLLKVERIKKLATSRTHLSKIEKIFQMQKRKLTITWEKGLSQFEIETGKIVYLIWKIRLEDYWKYFFDHLKKEIKPGRKIFITGYLQL